ncbi:TRAP transporter small permease [Oceanobacillus jeddahense]|uniref:TRAP transporter small permease n=1 Tax=Oceanobacillus jeddahense TaxID=1462527 RepID=A0ABY5JW38_9BACI|nr:TRAP transporter small permease [Oceanobacillus jeddahense]UUI03067.1 TRAP transporter small permease [Oceanobacillus jeddahense]
MKYLSYFENTLVILAMAGMAIITFANVLSRYFFDVSFAFAEELTINLFVLATLVGASIAIKRQSHFNFQFLYERLNPKAQKVVLVIISILMLAFLALIFIFGLELALNQLERGRMTPALNIPQWLFTLALPLGSLLCMIRTIEMTIIQGNFTLKRKHEYEEIEIERKELNS